jgi:hypothetical protein
VRFICFCITFFFLLLYLVRSLADNDKAWHISQRVLIPDAMEVAKRRKVPLIKANKDTRYLDKDRRGPRVVLDDQVRSGGWVLVTHGGFISHCHHDAEGLGTFMIINCGAKLWAIHEPQPDTPASSKREMFKHFDKLFDEGEDGHVTETILLERGDIL